MDLFYDTEEFTPSSITEQNTRPKVRLSRNFVIGISGNISSGKTTLALLLDAVIQEAFTAKSSSPTAA